jgi:hypothetical protein
MIVWGGDDGVHFLNDGGRYYPSADAWAGTITTGAPSFRASHTAVWTGTEMIIWGGTGYTGPVNTGGRYCAQPPSVLGILQSCSNSPPGPVPNVLLNITGTTSGSTLSDNSGNYQFSALVAGGSYTVTPTKSAAPGSPGITTADVIATQRHYLGLGPPLSGCRLTAADVNGDGSVNTVDVTAIQRFYLSQSTGIGNVGKYQFAPASRTYSAITSDQINQYYETLVFGDVAPPYVQ